MQGTFRFSFGPWNIHEGADPFGPEVRRTIPFNQKLEQYKKLGFDGIQFHDDDAVPNMANLSPAEIIKEASELKKKYFGPEGELFKKRESLMTPIQDEIYNAIKDIADQKGYSMVLDRASDNGIIYASPKIDISNEVLSKLGYN